MPTVRLTVASLESSSGWSAETAISPSVLSSDDGDTSAVRSNSGGDFMYFTLATSDLPDNAMISNIVFGASVSKINNEDALTRNLVKVGSSTYESGNFSPSAVGVYQNATYAFTSNPTNGQPWTTSDVASLQVGLKKENGAPQRCSFIYADVDYTIITSATTTSFGSAVSTMSVNLPANIAAENLLVAIVSVRNTGTWTLPTGWSQLFAPVAAGGVGGFTAFYKVATGSEGSSNSWTASTATTASWQVRRITSWHGTTPPEAATANSGGAVSTNNPPALTPSWGSANTLWLAAMGNTAQTVSITAAPAGYADNVANPVSSGGSAANTGTAYRQNIGATEDPAGFSTGSDRWWMAATIAIRPSGTVEPSGPVIKRYNGSSFVDVVAVVI